MKASIFYTIFSLAVAASAVPTGGQSNQCSTNQKQVCCNGILNCVVSALGDTCSGETYCCNSNAQVSLNPGNKCGDTTELLC